MPGEVSDWSWRASEGRQPSLRTVKRRWAPRPRMPSARLALAFLSFAFLHVIPALAHRLEAEAVVRPFGTVQVETWFETGDSPRGARVQVFRTDGRLLTEGRCDEHGFFVFAYDGIEPLRVVVNAGAGHRAEATVSRTMLTDHVLQTAVACLAPPPSLLAPPLVVPVKLASRPPAPLPLVKRDTGPPIDRLALGLGLLLAVAAAVVVRQRIRQVRKNGAPAGTTDR